MEEGIRVNKYLAECGICSRRGADELVNSGRVCVDGNVAVMGMKIMPGSYVTVDGIPIEGRDDKVYLALNKPRGIVCTFEKREKNNVIDFLKYPVRVTYAGRLDKESQGLLLLTNDGDMIDAMMRSRNNHEKEYIVNVHRPVTDAFLYKMSKGVYIEELDITTKKCVVERLDERQFKIIITEGHNRQIRRMCEQFGYHVRKLVRVRIMNIELGELPVGEYRELTTEELSGLKSALGMKLI